MADRVISCEFYWINGIVFSTTIPVAIWAIYQQHKQQKYNETPLLLYASTIAFYLSVICHTLSALISHAIDCYTNYGFKINNKDLIIHLLTSTSHQIEYIFVLIVLFLR